MRSLGSLARRVSMGALCALVVVACGGGTSNGTGGGAGNPGGGGQGGGAAGGGGSAAGGQGAGGEGATGGGGMSTGPGTCADPFPLEVPSLVDGDTADGASQLSGGDTCAVPTGNGEEVVYALTVPEGVTQLVLTVTPGPAQDPQPDLAIYVRTECASPAGEVACKDVGFDGGQEVLGVAVTPGESLFVVVDSYLATSGGSFTLDVASVAPESACGDLLDDDLDGLTDCQDPDCAVLPLCEVGTGELGAACTLASECASIDGDPTCLDAANFGYPNGYCSELCDITLQDCPGDGVCVQIIPGSNTGACFDGCNADGDCLGYHSCAELSKIDPLQPPADICYPYEKGCDDGLDQDQDGATDCADYDCQGAPTCLPLLCQGATVIGLGDTLGDSYSFGTNGLSAPCISENSYEQLFSYTPSATGTLGLTLESAYDLGMYVFTDCADVVGTLASTGSGPACVDASFGTTETMSVEVTAGVTYFIAVDSSNASESGEFTLSLQ